MTTRTIQYPRLAEELGGYAGSIASGTATTAVLTGKVGNTLDDFYNDWTLFMPDAANAGDRERVNTDWTGSSGTATWAGNRTDTTYTSETWFMLPPIYQYSLTDIQDAINKTLREAHASARTVIPTITGERHYPLSRFAWIETPDDVQGVFYRPSPCLVDNESFELWTNGPGSSSLNAAPTGWTVSGSGAIVYRTSNSDYVARGQYAAAIARVTNNVLLYQDIGLLNEQLNTLTVIASCRAWASVASRFRLQITDGVTTASSGYHSGGSAKETLTTTALAVAAAGTAVRLRVQGSLETGDTTAYMDHVLVEVASAINAALDDDGSQGYAERDLRHQVVMQGNSPVLMLGTAKDRGGQIVVVSRAPYASLSADATDTDIGADLLEAGTLYHLLAKRKPGQDRSALDVAMRRQGLRYSRLLNGPQPSLVQGPPPQVLVEAG